MTATVDRTVPYVPEAERALLGATLLSREAVEFSVAHINASDFYDPKLASAFDAVRGLYESGSHVDSATVATELRLSGRPDFEGELIALLTEVPATSLPAVRRYATSVKRAAVARQSLAALTAASDALYTGHDPYAVTEDLERTLDGLDHLGVAPARYWESIDGYLDQSDDVVGSWLIPGVCYRDSRILVLAAEKSGKSFALRQLAYCASQGTHPFRFSPMEPVRTLIVDAENPDREMLLTGRALRYRFTVENRWDPSRLALLSRPFGMDLRATRDRNELESVLESFKPALVVGGPIYKMLPAKDGENDVRHADAFQKVMGDMMRRHGFALVLEHHAPIGDKSGRPLRSMGGQRWQAWPDVTLALRAEGDNLKVEKPHPTRGQFDFPVKLERGGVWPWTATYTKAESAPPLPMGPDGPVYEDEEPF